MTWAKTFFLTEIWISQNQFSDISPLTSLTELEIRYGEYDRPHISGTRVPSWQFDRAFGKTLAAHNIKRIR